ncbi:MAG: hypothetical protein PW786_15205 [Arachidicoccus sp.]|nr:hypothetical protein [Arachidicoccus sp.]
MKYFFNIITIAFAAIMISTAASAQHRGGSHNQNSGSHGGYSHAPQNFSHGGNSHGGFDNRSGYAHHEFVNQAYANHGYPNHGYVNGRVYNQRGYYDRGGRYVNRREVFWGAAHRYAYARPVYFPAYHLYYDPARCGYTYWYGGRWLFSTILPEFLAGIDLAAADMAYANTIPQPYYAPAYPAAPGIGVNIHIGL